MAPRKGTRPAGERSETKIRLPFELRDELQKLAKLHQSSENAQLVKAVLLLVRQHDARTCEEEACVLARLKSR